MKYLLSFALLLLTSHSAFAAPNGEKLYNTNCSSCHNKDGLGGIGLPLPASKVVNFSDDYLYKTIRLGRKGRIMPAFSHLSESQVKAIILHIKSWYKINKTVTFSDEKIIGDKTHGKELYQQKCQACHGENGKSKAIGTGVTISRTRAFAVAPPDLSNPGYLASANDHFIKNTVISGRIGSIMPPFQQFNISDEDLNDIISYIRSLETITNETVEIETHDPTLIFDSPYDFDTTVKNIKGALSGLNFRYFPDRYIEMGLADDSLINKKQLSLRFCNFKQLYKMINTDPRLGIILPCRITIVENDEGEVKLYMMNMALITEIFNNEQLTHGAQEMHETMLEVIDEATL